VIMDYEPWDLHLHSKRKTVAVPYDSLDRIGQIMETYKVTHLTYYSPKYLTPLFDDWLIGFSRLVYYPHAYGKYIDSYPDLKKYAAKKSRMEEILQIKVDRSTPKVSINWATIISSGVDLMKGAAYPRLNKRALRMAWYYGS